MNLATPDAGDAHAGRAPSRSARRARARLQPPARGQPQRPGDREHRVRRRRGGGGAHQPRRRADRPTSARASKPATPTSSTCKPSRSERSDSSRGTHVHYDHRPASTIFPPARRCCRSRCSKRRSSDLVALPGVGMSILEISHRSKAVRGHPRRAAKRTCGRSAAIPDNYKVLFLQGGASLQFSMVPMNLLPAGGSADYVVTGAWSQKAVKEAKRVGGVKIAGDHRGRELHARAEAGRADARSGRRLRAHTRPTTRSSAPSSATLPDTGSVPLVADTSSDIFSAPDRRREVRADLRRRAEEPRAGRRDAGRSSARTCCAHRPSRCRRCCSTRCTSRTSRSTTRRRCSRSTSCGWC